MRFPSGRGRTSTHFPLVVNSEWLDTLACINADDVVYVDYVVAANRMCRFLRAKECELIIALTHMRAPNDQRLAEMAPDIDIILGGHDHDYYGLQVIGMPPPGRGRTQCTDWQCQAAAPLPHSLVGHSLQEPGG